MKAAFVSIFDTSNPQAWSGTVFHMLGALRKSGLEVEPIDALNDPYRFIFRAKRIYRNVVHKNNYLRDREPLVLSCYAAQVESRLTSVRPDIVFSPGTIPIAYLRTDKPIIFWTDATFAGMVNFYPEFTNLCDETIYNGHRMEQAALSNCRLAIYSSEWAAKTAINNYNVDGEKVKVVPFGANLTCVPQVDDIRLAIASRDLSVCKLLFVGVDWNRKGGDQALLVTSMLKRQGVDVELHLVGCKPPVPVSDFVKTYGYLTKDNRGHNAILSRLYQTSNFLIYPSVAESFGVAIAEANAYGVPALTTNVGGLNSVVRDGKNGQRFDRPTFVEDCTAYILQILSAKEQYYQLCNSSFHEYTTRLNWHSSVQAVLDLIRGINRIS